MDAERNGSVRNGTSGERRSARTHRTPRDDSTGLEGIAERIDAPVAADETVFTPSDATRIVRERAADIVDAKPDKPGAYGAADIAAHG